MKFKTLFACSLLLAGSSVLGAEELEDRMGDSQRPLRRAQQLLWESESFLRNMQVNGSVYFRDQWSANDYRRQLDQIAQSRNLIQRALDQQGPGGDWGNQQNQRGQAVQIISRHVNQFWVADCIKLLPDYVAAEDLEFLNAAFSRGTTPDETRPIMSPKDVIRAYFKNHAGAHVHGNSKGRAAAHIASKVNEFWMPACLEILPARVSASDADAVRGIVQSDPTGGMGVKEALKAYFRQ